jgi:hypothetical protein
MKRFILAIFWILIISSVMIFPQSNEKQRPSKWWLQSSQIDSTDSFLYHISGKYSFTKMNGVISGEMHSGYIDMVLRKSIFTNSSIYKIDKTNLKLINLNNLSFASTSHYFTDFLDVDFSKIVFSQFGFIWERDDAMLLANRYSFYAGIGLSTLLFEKLDMKSLFAGGRINQDYMIPVDNINVVKEPYTAFYFRQDFEYTINQSLSFSGQVYYFTNIHEKNRYRYGIGLDLSLGLIEHVNIVAGYNYKYDRENILLGIIPDNSTENIGVEISL